MGIDLKQTIQLLHWATVSLIFQLANTFTVYDKYTKW